MLRLFDTAQGRVVPFEPRTPGEVSMYVCGPTVYGPPHLGHGRFALVFDVLRRYLEWTGLEVRYVSNITDIDDKIIELADAQERDPAEVALENERIWYEVMDAIGVERPTADPHATQYVEEMVALIGRLVEAGSAYEISDGVYFSPDVVSDYGLLARQSIESLQAGARVEANDEKRSPIDFALWKKAKPGEPAWPSPWGPGRPGWHTECVVMSLDLLGEGFDLHGGGQDLAFPHHENERAQALADGHRFASHWMHNGFVEVSGEKMSKSLHNFTNMTELLDAADPRAYRLLVLRAHYRSPLEVNPTTTEQATRSLERLDAVVRRAAAEFPAAEYPVGPDVRVLDEFRERMDDDLDTPAALALLFTLVSRANQAADDGDLMTAAATVTTLVEIAGALGLVLDDGGEDVVPAEVLALAAERDTARSARDWVTADARRDEIQALGYVVEDTPGGTQVRSR